MQALQKEETAKGVVWLRINSGRRRPRKVRKRWRNSPVTKKRHQVASTESLLDAKGKVGHLYGARTTPHMFVIDDKGVLVYAGGIDDKPSADPADAAPLTELRDDGPGRSDGGQAGDDADRQALRLLGEVRE